jgi:hypothetical protein
MTGWARGEGEGRMRLLLSHVEGCGEVAVLSCLFVKGGGG